MSDMAAGSNNSLRGTPYWMAPEVIEMAGVSAACDVWSVGCTVVELLTEHPPYFDLQPMAALFRIVQDAHPPLPDAVGPAGVPVSRNLRDFLLKCFKKEPLMRPPAETLLSHPWVRTGKGGTKSSTLSHALNDAITLAAAAPGSWRKERSTVPAINAPME